MSIDDQSAIERAARAILGVRYPESAQYPAALQLAGGAEWETAVAQAHAALSAACVGVLARESLAEVIEPVIAGWVSVAHDIACATVDTIGDEPAMRKAFDRMRHLYLAEPWIPAGRAADAVLAALGAPTTDRPIRIEWGVDLVRIVTYRQATPDA